MRDVNHETLTDTQSWYKILPLNGFNLIRARGKTSQETENSLQKFLEPTWKPKVIYTDNSCEKLTNLVKICHGIIVHQHLSVQKLMVLLKSGTQNKKKGRVLQAWVKNGGLILWNAVAIQ